MVIFTALMHPTLCGAELFEGHWNTSESRSENFIWTHF